MQKISLLVADDEDVFRRGIVHYITHHSERFHPILAAVDGEEAEQIIFRNRPDLMLLDIMMPKKNGIEVMQETQNVGIMPVTIILSGYDEFKYAQQALRFGAKDYILKPMLASEILKRLNQAADQFFGQETNEEKPDGKKAKGDQKGEKTKGESEGRSFVMIAREYMEDHYDEDLTLDSVAERVGISSGYLSTLFVRTFGYGFVECLNRIRVDHASPYLQQNYLKTYEIAYKVGFHDEKYFSKVFRKIMGVTPSEYRKQKGSVQNNHTKEWE